ncbi:MAG: Gfo/Idh/MocA family oxidoreductase [Propionibacteriaceae bacterium]|jgi:predicted dehydrogenase|nr:Gfo/Idh/MocA family oxidoreductase [Propionibacteriaceae bacterium]
MAFGIGLIGVGNISAQYLDTFTRASSVEVIAVAGLGSRRAASVAAAYGVEALAVEELLDDKRIQLVVNLTVPAVHAQIDAQIIAAGKHVYAEKPLALTTAQGQAVLEAAASAGVLVGSAPDTVLGTGIQTSVDAVRSGRLGEPFAASILWGAAGPELWHPDPEFYYQSGGGPVLDMGPYYLTALVHLLGPVRSVVAHTRTSGRQRVIGTGPKAGKRLAVEVPTYAAALLEHVSGAVSTVTVSFETWGHNNEPFFEIYGTAGSLRVPDPNKFEERAWLYDAHSVVTSAEEAQRRWEPLPVSAGFQGSGRGIGVVDMVEALEQGRTHRASGAMALHVLEILEAIEASEGKPVSLSTTAETSEVIPLRDVNMTAAT